MEHCGRSRRALLSFFFFGLPFLCIPGARADSDITPPQIVELNFTPTTITSNSTAQPVTFTLHITDDSSGFQGASWHFVSPSDQTFYIVSINGTDRISGTSLDGIYAKVLNLPAGCEIGHWHVARMRAVDVAGNVRTYDDMPFYNSPTLFTPSSGVYSIFVRDFNQDNIADICIYSGTTTVTVYPGSSNGTFGTGITSPVPSNLQGPYIGDFNGDGIPDLAFNEYPDFYSATTPVGILFGNANGSFQPYRVVGSMPYEVGPSIGDFDGDGKDDMAGVGWSGGGLLDPGTNGMVFLWGRNDGNFDRTEPAIDYGGWRVGHILYAAEVNGDNIPDLIWSKYEGTTSGKLIVMLGQGNRTFGNPIEYATAMRAVNFANADFNLDGETDLAVYDELTNSIRMLPGQGDGSFLSAVSILSYGGSMLSTGDFDHDGMPDLAANAGDGFDLLINNGDGSFRTYTLTPGMGNLQGYGTNLGYGSGDFNSDGLTDFAVGFPGSTFGVYLGIPTISVALSQSGASSTFGQTVTLTATVTPSDLLGPVTFYDGAKVIGSALLSGGQAIFTTKTLTTGTHALSAAYRGTLMGIGASFSPDVAHTVIPGPTASKLLALDTITPGFIPARLAAGDFDKDGSMDLAATDYWSEGTTYTFQGNGNGTLLQPQKYTYGWTGNRFVMRPVTTGDWNHDGNLDLETGTETGTYEYRGIGDGTFQMAYSVPGYPILADVNRDGTLDRIYANGTFISVLLGIGDRNGKPAHFPISSAAGGVSINEIAVGDLDNDGYVDVAAAAKEANLLSILIGNGDGTFQSPATIAAGNHPTSPVIGDFDADGNLDLAVILESSGTIRILPGQGDGTFSSPIDMAIGGTITRMIAADLDGNGTSDLAVLSETLDRVLVFPGNGNSSFGNARMYFTATYPTDIIAADFNGDGRTDLAVASRRLLIYEVSGSGRITILLGVNPSPSSVTLSISAPSSALSQGVTMTATVGPSGAQGWVTFYDGATALGSVQVSGGQAVFQTRRLSSGTHQLRAAFSGNQTAYSSSISTVTVHNVKASAVFAFGPPAPLFQTTQVARATQADFDMDGKVDLAVCNNSTGYLTVLLGQGNGQFSAGSPFPSCSGTPLPADFDLDGKTDLVTAGAILRGKGDGTFYSPQSIVGLSGSTNVLTADFNADGVPDILDIGYSLVFLNRGNGTFETPINLSFAFALNNAVAADVNGDGRADLVAPDSGGYVYIALGRGDGTFLTPVRYATISGASKVQVADFDGDGILDIAVGNGNQIGIMLGLGSGSFENWGESTTGLTSLQNLVICDYDGDGKTDLLVAGSMSGAQKIRVLHGTGDGSFDNAVDYVSITDSWLGFVSDLNLDGKPDLVIYPMAGGVYVKMAIYPSSVALAATPCPAKLSQEITLTATVTPVDATGTVAFYDGVLYLGTSTLSGGQATFKTKSIPTGTHKLRALYNGDPLNYVNSQSSDVSLTVTAGRSGGFAAAANFSTGRGPQGVAVGDLNGDGKPDLVVANATSNTLSVLLGNGDGTFATRVTYNTGSAPVAVAILDLNKDGKPDVAAANSGGNNVNVLLGNGDGTLQEAVNYAVGGPPNSLFAADINNDQYMDLLISATNGITALLGTSGTISVSSITSGSWNGIGAADLNNDGRADIPALASSGSIRPLMQGAGFTFSMPSLTAVGTTPTGPAMGDFNADGKLDLATANTGSNNVSVALGVGDGTFQVATSYTVDSGPNAIVATDCSGDGNLDLAVVNGASNTVSILRGKGDGTFVAGATIPTGNSPKGIIAADFDGNGITDLAVSNSAGNNISVFLGSRLTAPIDYDADLKSDYTIWRPSSGVWYGVRSSVGDYFATQWGTPNDVPTPGDYDGDGQSDIAVWRPSSGVWYLLPSKSPGTYTGAQWGVESDVPVVADYDGDGKDDIAVYRPGSGTWYVLPSGSPGTYAATKWGTENDIPLPRDLDGDGKKDIAVYRPGTGMWYVLQSASPGTYVATQWGVSTDIPTPGDYDGDGKTDVAVWRPSSGTWYILPSNSPGTYTAAQWGADSDIPVVADYDGDGRDDIAVYQRGSGIWYVLPSNAPGTYTAIQWGVSTDLAISSLTGILRSIP
jgi:hypothetical protein